jgi:endonuclease YncB( thermonuclease family)
MRSCFLSILLGLIWTSAANAMPLPDCAGKVVAAQARVTRVEKDGTLILGDGRTALLAGLRLPGADAPGSDIAKAALWRLRQRAMEGPLTLTTTAPEKDRYGRLRVQAFGTVWLQTELLRHGLARVSVAPDRQECAPDFYEAETAARDAGRGLWALPQFAVRDALSLSAAPGSFQLVAGRVVNIARHDGRVFIDFAQDYRKGFSATVAPKDSKAFRDAEPVLEDLLDRRVRLRGIVEGFGGRREIALSNPKQIEILK